MFRPRGGRPTTSLARRCFLAPDVHSGSPRRHASRLTVEELESRDLLSVSPTHIIISSSSPSGPIGFTPAQIRHAYGIDRVILNGGIIGDGQGQTIAIIDAYDNPQFVSSTDPGFLASDLHRFDLTFGLPDPPHFFKLDQHGGTSYPSVDPMGDWGLETALDVEWAHALAPAANIVLIEANDALDSNLGQAVNVARSIPRVSVVSMSGGSPEIPSDLSSHTLFTTPAGHQGITFIAAAGDDGAGNQSGGFQSASHPAVDPNVLAVGGTSLVLDSQGNYESETAWGSGRTSDINGGSGGGISTVFPKPSYQYQIPTLGGAFRSIPDVAFLADPETGVAVYDSYDSIDGRPWVIVGGTSLSTPSWAAIIAIADQGRALDGLGTLDGPTQTLPRLYQIGPGYFHDITTGNNGFPARPGFDLATGRGTPIVNYLVPALVGGANQIIGVVYSDVNADGLLEQGEPGLSGITVYLDANNNGIHDANEISTVTDSGGNYAFVGVGPGQYLVRQEVHSGWTQISDNPPVIVLTGGDSSGNAGGFGDHDNSVPLPPAPPPPPRNVPPPPPSIYVTGADAGGSPQVNVYDSTTQELKFAFMPYSAGFRGGVRVAVGDLNGDGRPEIVTGAGPGGGPQVEVFDGLTGQLLRSFFALSGPSLGTDLTGTAAFGNTGALHTFTGGIFVATGDVFGTGYDDIIVGADAGGGPQVQVFDGKSGVLVASFYAFSPAFTGGVRVAAGDVFGTGIESIIAGAGKGGGPQVSLFSGSGELQSSFFAFSPRFTGGVYVSAGDVSGSGRAAVIAGAGAGGGPQVLVYDAAAGGVLDTFFATDAHFKGGVRVSARDVNGDGRADVLTTLGSGGAPQIAAFDNSTLAILMSYYAYAPGFRGGVFVG